MAHLRLSRVGVAWSVAGHIFWCMQLAFDPVAIVAAPINPLATNVRISTGR
jgi:hypothetical protein